MIKATEKAPHSPDAAEAPRSGIEYLKTEEKPHFGERLARNMALAGMVLLAVTAVRNAELPSGETVLTAVQQMTTPNWDESLGKISFVSNLFPESVAVFFDTGVSESLTAPCAAAVSHMFSAEEPYIGYQAAGQKVYAVSDGQVMSIAHGMNEERIIRLRHDDGIESLYYNLSETAVREGDSVTASTCLGVALPGAEPAVEVRRAGRAIDPTALMTPRQDAP
ncbi:MAG: M23 family metallopeptidase [Clostridia bacterium]|nr:M23 family metallopeptidase [Clostridia bacterium]